MKQFDKTNINQDKDNQEDDQQDLKQKKSIRKKLKIIINISDTQYPIIRIVAQKILKWKIQYEDDNSFWDVFWTDKAVQPEFLAKLQCMHLHNNYLLAHQKVNHYPGMYALARKNFLGKNLMKMKKVHPDDYNFFPQTWMLPSDYCDFRNQFQKGKVKTFIIKPEANCQGRGIFLTRNLEDVNIHDHYVAQRYIHKPYLIDGLKFDLRLYVLLADCDPLRIYFYKEGLARFATQPYELPCSSNMDDMWMHLTNYAINKENPLFVYNKGEGEQNKGHKRSLTSVLDNLRRQGFKVDDLLARIKDMIIKTFCTIQPLLAQKQRNYQNLCFEILGFDILLDHKCIQIFDYFAKQHHISQKSTILQASPSTLPQTILLNLPSSRTLSLFLTSTPKQSKISCKENF